MDQSGWLWAGLFVLIAVVAGVALYLYLDYRAGRDRARAARLQQGSGRPLPPPVPPLPGKVEELPRIVFGKTYDVGDQGGPGLPNVQQVTGTRTCPVCRRPINAEDYLADRVIICPHCRTHVHVECWEYSSNRCPVCGQ